jgi:VCBS repeat-containing protein
VDSSQTFVLQSGVAGSNGYGTFSISAAGLWNYTTNTAHNEFVGGTTYTDSITVTSADGTASQLVTVSILGTNDAPTDIDFAVAPPPSGTTLPGANATIATLSTDDVDNASGFTYSLTSQATTSGTAATFALGTTSGVLTTTSGLSASSIYTVKFVSTDAGGLATPEQTLTIITGKNNASDNPLPGQTGDDIIYALNSGGGINKDVIFAGSGDDTVFGQDGVDEIHGGAGIDVLSGGAGNDTFYFDTTLNATTNVDTITDFTSGSDKLYLANGLGPFSAIATGSLTVAAPGATLDILGDLGANTAPSSATRIIYDPSSGALYYDADGTGAGLAIQFATLGTTTHPSTLTGADFVVGP